MGGSSGGRPGAVGDFYLDTATDNVYKKTGVSTWTLQARIEGRPVQAGAQGPAGTIAGSDGHHRDSRAVGGNRRRTSPTRR